MTSRARIPHPCLKRLINPLALKPHPAQLKKLRNWTSPLNLPHEMSKLLALTPPLSIRLHPRFQIDILPIRIPLLPFHKHGGREQPVDSNMPFPQRDAVVFGDDEAGDLVAGTETGGGVGDGGGRGVLAAEEGVGVCW
jgi:hypothetical protein